MPDLFGAGVKLYNCYHPYVLIDGPRWAGKTVAACHKMIRHCWENDNAIFGIVAKTKGNAKSGVWTHGLINFCIPQWEKNCKGFKLAKGESMTADSKMSFVRINNYYGGISEIQLHSLVHDEDVEKKFKGTNFSGMYVSEADQFGTEIKNVNNKNHVFNVFCDQLRIPSVPEEHHQIILDTNPPEDGEDNWMYPIFFDPPEERLKHDPDYRSSYVRIPFTWDDNPWMSPKKRRDLLTRYSHDANLKARYILGKWVKDLRNGMFSDVLIPNTHFIGNATAMDPSQWEVLTPASGTFEMAVGWDPGDVNHGVAMAAPRSHPHGNIYDFVDEVAIIGQKCSLDDLTMMVMEQMDKWERFMLREFGVAKVLWRHWSDSSVDKYRASANADDAATIFLASGGRINLMGVDKIPGSVMQRIKLLRKFLFNNRAFFSASMVFACEMLQRIKKGRSVASPFKRNDPYKQIFDPITYLLQSESPMDMEERMQDQRSPTDNSIIVST